MLNKFVDKIADKVRWRYLIGFFILLASYILTYYTTQELLKQSNWINHTNSVINNLEALHSAVKDRESALRGFVATKDEKFLDGYQNTPVVDSLFRKISALMVDNSTQVKKLDSLKHLVREKYFLLDEDLTI